jgi:hypothetical protein
VDRYAKLARDGYHVVQSAAVPVPATSIRFDIRGKRTGSVEEQLPSPQAQSQSAREVTPHI